MRPSEPTVCALRVPASAARTGEAPRWEVSYGSETTGWVVIGWIVQRDGRSTKRAVHIAIGIHPRTGQLTRLQDNVDFDEQANAIADFHLDPNTPRRYLGLNVVDSTLAQDGAIR